MEFSKKRKQNIIKFIRKVKIIKNCKKMEIPYIIK